MIKTDEILPLTLWLYPLNSDTFGELLDPFDGLKDMENKVLKTPLRQISPTPMIHCA
jgi:hypothetical protein